MTQKPRKRGRPRTRDPRQKVISFQAGPQTVYRVARMRLFMQAHQKREEVTTTEVLLGVVEFGLRELEGAAREENAALFDEVSAKAEMESEEFRLLLQSEIERGKRAEAQLAALIEKERETA